MSESELLCEAADRGDAHACRELLFFMKGETRLDDPDGRGWSLLHRAIASRSTECALLFVEIAGDEWVDARTTEERCTPLLVACRTNMTAVAYALVSRRRAEVFCPNVAMETALHHAVWNRNFWICKLLLENGHPPHTPTLTGETPLFHAARARNRDICEILLWYNGLIRAPLTSSAFVMYMNIHPRPDWSVQDMLRFARFDRVSQVLGRDVEFVDELLRHREWSPKICEVMERLDEEPEELRIAFAIEISEGLRWLNRVDVT